MRGAPPSSSRSTATTSASRISVLSPPGSSASPTRHSCVRQCHGRWWHDARTRCHPPARTRACRSCGTASGLYQRRASVLLPLSLTLWHSSSNRGPSGPMNESSGRSAMLSLDPLSPGPCPLTPSPGPPGLPQDRLTCSPRLILSCLANLVGHVGVGGALVLAVAREHPHLRSRARRQARGASWLPRQWEQGREGAQPGMLFPNCPGMAN